jgi:hypothetical protein
MSRPGPAACGHPGEGRGPGRIGIGFASAFAAALALASIAPANAAGREPVLKQVDLPHSYYWRELYLPQLTRGPSALAFFPDSRTVAMAMDGSLWRQALDQDVATELTHPKGAYDHQPDVAPDGRSIVFVRYDGAAMELWRLDLGTHREQRLTSEGAVNVEPRLSPDGRRLAWVSTQGTGHFNLFVADLDAQGLHGARMLLGERRSDIDRYYYSAVDHAINPAWSPDGKSLLYVGNPEVAWGSGDLWLVDVAQPSQRRKVWSEETSWSARPQFAPDGKRIVFSSYHGRQTHQLWLTTVDGAPPLPLTFGEGERRDARWSPDGARIAYIASDYDGTRLRVLDLAGGQDTDATPAEFRTKQRAGVLRLVIRDARGQPVRARVSVVGSDGRAHGPLGAALHADDGFDRALQPLEAHYTYCVSTCEIELPPGVAHVEVQHGFAHRRWKQDVEVRAGGSREVAVHLQALALPPEFGAFASADLHVHMNYGGHYRMLPRELGEVMRAEDLDVAENLIVNKEERIPDVRWFGHDRLPDVAFPLGVRQRELEAPPGIAHAQEFHSSWWGHLALLGLRDHLVLPDFTSYRHTALASPYPHNGVVADLAHAQGGVVGYVHPFDTVPDPAKDEVLTHELPADVAHGKVDYLEVVGFSDHKATAAVWYRLLNLGFHLPAGAGTDAMANYASLRGPVGMNRVFLDTGGKDDEDAILAALKAGHGFVSNGPLLGLLVDGQKPGATVPAKSSWNTFRVAMRSIVPVDHLELVVNGVAVRTFELGGDHTTFDGEGTVTLPPGGWVLLRARNDGADPAILDIYPYATTNPVWTEGDVVADRADVDYFVAWLDRVIAAADARTDWNTAQEKADTLAYLRAAQDKFRAMVRP